MLPVGLRQIEYCSFWWIQLKEWGINISDISFKLFAKIQALRCKA